MCIPEGVSFDKLNRILIAYLKAGADKKAVSYMDASIRSGIRNTMVSRNNKFLLYAGFLSRAKRRLKLTEQGVKYAQLMDWGRLDEAKDQLAEILKKCPLIEIVLDYVTINNEVTRDDLRRKIGAVAEVSKSIRFTIGINALIDMLAFSGLLQEKDGMYRRGEEIQTVSIVGPTGVEREKMRPVTPSAFGTFGELEIAKPKEVSIPISLTVNVTDITDIQKLRKILKVIKEELVEEKESR